MKLLSLEVEVTNSLSNLIKAPFVNLSGKEAYIINSEKFDEKFVPLHEDKEEFEEVAAASEVEISGNVIHIEDVLEEEREKYREEATRVLADARAQAELLLDSARREASEIKEKARLSGHTEGYAAGEVSAREKYDELQEKLQIKCEQQDEEYEHLINEIEPKYVDVLISLLQKITGVLIEDQDDIILYLIKSSIRNLDKSERYSIRISKEDAYVMESRKNEIRQILGDEAIIEIVEEKSLNKNECIIETDNQMIDCGFKTQLNNLIETLKLMVV